MPEPIVGKRYKDNKTPNRLLRVIEVVPQDPAGRNVRGKVSVGLEDERDYATDFRTFAIVWEEMVSA